jgi:hypothetical protein
VFSRQLRLYCCKFFLFLCKLRLHPLDLSFESPNLQAQFIALGLKHGATIGLREFARGRYDRSRELAPHDRSAVRPLTRIAVITENSIHVTGRSESARLPPMVEWLKQLAYWAWGSNPVLGSKPRIWCSASNSMFLSASYPSAGG